MGLAVERDDFTEDDYDRFSAQLTDGLAALRELLARPGFGSGPPSLGAELELSLVDEARRPSLVNLEVLGETFDSRLTFELDRFNLECNLRHGPLAGRPFEQLADEMRDSLREVRRAAAHHDAEVAAIGILPTLRHDDLQSGAMTDTARFRALSRGLQRLRSEPFHLRIDGLDPLDTRCSDVTFEGAATSLQIHLRVDPRDFSRFFNAAQIATVAAVAVGGNSPTFLGHRLWQETRIALFKQAVDARSHEDRRSGRQARVSFGSRWIEGGALELFTESVERHAPLLPIVTDEQPLGLMRRGGIPRLEEIRLHQGTVWSWNRPVYDPADGGHLRIELRSLPAGPSVVDMVANAAFVIGLTCGIAAEEAAWRQNWEFDRLHDGFYRGAQSGLDATLDWPDEPRAVPTARPAADVVERTLPIARRGLLEAGVESEGIDPWLDVIAARAARRKTGSQWQLRALEAFARSCDRPEALARMLGRYVELSREGRPVHEWPDED